jgi:methylthioribose-1-phosphate isomerase
MPLLKPIQWDNGTAKIIDQRQLPEQLIYESIDTVQGMFDAIRQLKVRGAPLIGISAAYGICVAIRDFKDSASVSDLLGEIARHATYLATSRPTAVNLFWALDRMQRRAKELAEQLGGVAAVKEGLLQEAHEILQEDRQTCRLIGEYGYEELKHHQVLHTHCNAGGLATGEFGTALAPIYVGLEHGKSFEVYVDETRPLLQGARITAFELTQAGVAATLICDNMAGAVMRTRKVDAVIVGADRIAANGDAANKIGTYSLAVLARAHNIPFYVAAPMSTFDLSLPTGDLIPIEERAAEEITEGFGKRTAPAMVKVFNPAFDVTPHELITGIITERGVFKPPFDFS